MENRTSIILVNYNNHDDTLKCLASISEAGYGDNVIVVDNNSTTPGVDRIKEQFPATVLIKHTENAGFGKGNNIGIDWALANTRSEYLFLLNNDTTIEKTTVPVLENALAADRNAGIAAPKIVMMEAPDVLWYGGGEINWKKCSARIPDYLGPATGAYACASKYVSFASGCAMLVRRSVLEDIGGFDQRFFMYVEDVEFCIRALKNGTNILYVPGSVVSHKGQGSQRGDQKFYPIEHPGNPKLPFFVYHLTRNRIITISLHASKTNALKFWVYYPVFMCFRSFQYLMFRRFDALRAMKEAWSDARQTA